MAIHLVIIPRHDPQKLISRLQPYCEHFLPRLMTSLSRYTIPSFLISTWFCTMFILHLIAPSGLHNVMVVVIIFLFLFFSLLFWSVGALQ